LDAEYRQILDILGYEPTAVDLIVERSGLTAEAVSSMLLVLELQGYVDNAPGGGYQRTSLRETQ
ncbi:MAG: DNA-protecting protein DprA, partial [Gammaproteobacteria bacterium]|nr:DNA-protecting protein DprA [Gammaproteobacteria bacterium]